MKRKQIFNPFRGMNSAPLPSGGTGSYVEAGDHVLLIEELKNVESQQSGDSFFCAEFTVVESDNDNMEAGKRVSWMVNFKWKLALGNIKLFLAAVLDCDLSDVNDWESIANAMTQKKQPARGTIVHCVATDITTVKNKAEFTKISLWEHVASAEDLEEDEEEAPRKRKKRRAA